MKKFCYVRRQTHAKFGTISAVEVPGKVSGGRTAKLKISEEAKQDSIEAIRELHGKVSSSFRRCQIDPGRSRKRGRMNKKTMFAISALCAAVALTTSAVESDIVGYQTQDTASSGFAMKAASFETVGATDGSATLADIKITGYDPYDEEEDEGGTSGDFYIQFLNASGKTSARYEWVDDDVRTGWVSGGSIVDATKVTIPAGTGVWVKGAGLTLTIPSPLPAE